MYAAFTASVPNTVNFLPIRKSSSVFLISFLIFVINSYYVNYYMETGRDQPLRADRLTLKEIRKFLQVCERNKLNEYVLFHNGNDEFYYSISDYLNRGHNLFEGMYFHEFNKKNIVTPKDLVRVALLRTHRQSRRQNIHTTLILMHLIPLTPRKKWINILS
jgi:hypothetical protein